MIERHPVCSCGSLRFDYGLVMFPLVWMAVCLHCGKETACHLQVAQKPAPIVRRHGGFFDPYGRWHDHE